MPEEVCNWCKKNILNINFYNQTEGWKTILNPEPQIFNTDIFSLPKDFELEPKSKGGWVEYEIDKDGFFHIRENNSFGTYHWSEWNKVFELFYGVKNIKITAFGGWQYEEDGDWYMSPRLSLIDDDKSEYYTDRYTNGKAAERVKPLIPLKIRFWREAK